MQVVGGKCAYPRRVTLPATYTCFGWECSMDAASVIKVSLDYELIRVEGWVGLLSLLVACSSNDLFSFKSENA